MRVPEEETGVVSKYLVEAYLPLTSDSELAQAGRRARAGAEELTREGSASVRYLRTIFLPAEETCFHLYEGPSAEAVGEAARRAAINFDRIVEATDHGGEAN